MSEVMTPEEVRGLIAYKYNGGDTSLVYKYLLSPFAQFLVDYCVPTWVAPNLITFIGLVFSLISFFLTLIYNYDLGVNGPRWLPLVVAINLFIYQTLDNMDGKQARKTGTSSPLGMLFDHGIDAINSVLLTLPVGSALGTGMSRHLLILLSVGFIPFITQGWEEYYREEMVLPIINGPTEGLLVTMGMLVFSSMYGAEAFHVVSRPPFSTWSSHTSTCPPPPRQL
jgi:ethanolaminephosphotransferase